MSNHIRSNVVAYVALFFALSGGAAWATHPGGANTISSGDIINGEVKSPDVGNGEVKNDDLGSDAVGSGKIADRQVKNADLSIGASSSNTIADGGIEAIDVKNNTLTGTQIDESTLEIGDAPGFCEGAVAGTGQMANIGSYCIDEHENSIWTQPNGGTQLITEGEIDAACPNNGQPSGAADCDDFYARSVAGVEPARSVTWFQAQQALANSGKRLPTNAEWQQAVAGTPDSTDCNVSSGSVQNTGANAACVSRFGALDMVGNVEEWVGDWVPASSPTCPGWDTFSDDVMCLSGTNENIKGPGALRRGGSFGGSATSAGPFAVLGNFPPQSASIFIGFRGAR